LDTDLVSLTNGWGCEEAFELGHLFLVVTALFIGNGILFAIPKGDGNALACFAVGEEVDPTIAFL